MWILYILLGLLVLVGLYLFAIAPRMVNKPDASILMHHDYAHRGLHDNAGEAPENSMAAFCKAVESGYGIELDVQLTKDRIPVIFHDETLKRVCKAPGKVRDYTYEELQQFHLCDSEEKIPLFADFLRMVNGRVPLIVEIKIHENATEVCSKVDEILKPYVGPYCMESFHPLAVRWYKKNRPEVIRGQLSSNFREDGKEPIERFLVHHLLFNFLARPDFIAYNHKYKKAVSRTICQKFFHALSVAWTIRSQKEMDDARDAFSLFIFESFIPRCDS